MILVETLPQRMHAIQWNEEGDARELGEQPYFIGKEQRFGVPTMSGGMQRLRPGDWVVLGTAGDPQVFGANEFHHKFRIIEEGQVAE